MRQSRIIIFLLSLIWLGCDTSGNVDPVFNERFVKYYGDEGDQAGADLAINEDGSMLLLGNSILADGTSHAFVIKVDPVGNVLWQLDVGGNNETAIDLDPIVDANSFVVVSNIGPPAFSKIRLSVISQDGTILSSKIINDDKVNFTQVAKSVTALQQKNGFVVTGHADNNLVVETTPMITPANDMDDILAFEFDSELNLLDTIVTKGGELNGSGIKVFETENNPVAEFILFGYSDRPYLTNDFKYNFTYDFLASGVPIGSPVGSEEELEELATVIKTPAVVGEGFLMAGTSRSVEGGPGDIYVVKLNKTLENKSLDRKLGLGRDLTCVAAENASFGYYILSNETRADGRHDISLVRIGLDGSEPLIRNYGSPEGDDTAAAIKTLGDGRIVIVGTMELKTRKKLALMVLNANGDF